MRVLGIFLLVAAASIAFAKEGGIARGSQGGTASSATVGPRAGGGGGGSTLRGGFGERKAPPLDPARKVSEQDCSKPIDLQAGNLRCK